MSYGAHADDLLTTAAPRARTRAAATRCSCWPRGDQTDARADERLGHARHARHLQPGLRRPRRRSRPSRSSPTPFADIAAQTMVPVTHILWAHVWLGIATAPSTAPARSCAAQAREQARHDAADGRRAWRSSLSRAARDARRGQRSRLRRVRGMIDSGAGPRRLLDDGFALRMNNLKISASEQAPRICQRRAAICGIVGLQERHAVQRRAPPPRRAVGVADDRQRPHPRDERIDAARAQGRLSQARDRR